MSRPLTVTRADARRFLRSAHRFDARVPGAEDVLAYHGYVQIDPINVCGRMHDHILRNRVAGYREGGLMGLLHGPDGPQAKEARQRTAFEHHLPSTDVLAAFPLEAWPHMLSAMRGRTRRASAWLGRLTARERELARSILERFSEAGPLGPEAFADERRGRRVWGSSTLAKATLQKLFFHGRLLIARRQSNRRLYDLPERVLPRAVIEKPEPDAAETDRWLALLRLRQHRLVRLLRRELVLVADAVRAVSVEGCPVLHCLEEDVGHFEPGVAASGAGALLLAPLDPCIYDREVTRRLWYFDYAWEAYTPPAKRTRGYYAFPVLSGTELVGHVDAKADRPGRRLVIVSRRVRRGHKVSGPVAELAAFLGCGSSRRPPR